MFFSISKTVGQLADPAVLLLLLFSIGTVLLTVGGRRRRGLGVGLVTAATSAFLFLSIVPIGDWLLAPLEDRFARLADIAPPPDGIVVLGGAIDSVVSRGRGMTALGPSAERMTAMTMLARRFPDARLVFTGGSGRLLHADAREAHFVAAFLAEQGIDPARLTIEDESRNTFENAAHTLRLVRPDPGERWLIVTSARHMPRSVGVFRAVGWSVVPYPVNYLTPGVRMPLLVFQPMAGLFKTRSALREWAGLAVYRMTGRTKELFPAPDAADVAR